MKNNEYLINIILNQEKENSRYNYSNNRYEYENKIVNLLNNMDGYPEIKDTKFNNNFEDIKTIIWFQPRNYSNLNRNCVLYTEFKDNTICRIIIVCNTILSVDFKYNISEYINHNTKYGLLYIDSEKIRKRNIYINRNKNNMILIKKFVEEKFINNVNNIIIEYL